MKDKFNRELFVGDICFRIKSPANRFAKAITEVVKIQDFTESKVKLAERCFVNSDNLIKANDEGLEGFIK